MAGQCDPQTVGFMALGVPHNKVTSDVFFIITPFLLGTVRSIPSLYFPLLHVTGYIPCIHICARIYHVRMYVYIYILHVCIAA